jgi:hypothetical protein
VDWVEVGEPLRGSARDARSMRNVSGARPEVRHHLLGFAVLLVAVVPAYLAARGSGSVGPGNLAGAEAGVTTEVPSPEAATPELDRFELDAHIHEVAARYKVPPRLVAAIIEAESEFNPRAVSRRGARGLMQLMPTTAASLQIGDSFDPFANVEGGVRHLRRLMKRYRGHLPLVLAAYNAGEQAVRTHRGIPPYPETRRYVRRIMRRLGPAGVTAVRPAERARAVGLIRSPGNLADVLRPTGPDAARASAAALAPPGLRGPTPSAVAPPVRAERLREARMPDHSTPTRGSNPGP